MPPLQHRPASTLASATSPRQRRDVARALVGIRYRPLRAMYRAVDGLQELCELTRPEAANSPTNAMIMAAVKLGERNSGGGRTGSRVRRSTSAQSATAARHLRSLQQMRRGAVKRLIADEGVALGGASVVG